MSCIIGSLIKVSGEFEWLIKLSDEILESKTCLESPTFSFLNESWYCEMYPKSNLHTGNISLYLYKEESTKEIKMHYSVEMILNGMQLRKWENEYHIFKKSKTDWGKPQYICRTDVLDLWSKKTEDCQLTIKIRMSGEKEDTLLKKRKEGIKILGQNLKDMLHHDEGHDVTMKVKNREFKVHKIIMQYRCPVFKAMLNHDMLEKNRGVVEIPDCDPLAFEQFIHYVYCGDLEILDESFVLGLYYIADKYEMACLKEMCREFIKKSLSPCNVCGVIKLALNHSDTSLLECGKKYYIDNVKEVLVTVEWQSFVKENFIQANELIIESFNNYVPEKEETETTKTKRQKCF